MSERTIYRDIRDLMASGVPIEGEAGVGYVLRAGFDLPPLMFKEAEIEALVLGARIVESWADEELAEAASDAIAKIEAVIPERLRGYMASTALLAPPHALHGADQLRPRRSAAGGARPDQGAFPLHATCWRGRASGRCGRCRSPISARSGCWRPGASCATTSAPSGSTGSTASACTADRFRPEPGKTLHDFLKRTNTWTRSGIGGDGRDND